MLNNERFLVIFKHFLLWWKNRIQFLINLMKHTLLFTLWKCFQVFAKAWRISQVLTTFLINFRSMWIPFKTTFLVSFCLNFWIWNAFGSGQDATSYSRDSNLPLAISKLWFNPGICFKSNTRFMARKQLIFLSSFQAFSCGRSGPLDTWIWNR